MYSTIFSWIEIHVLVMPMFTTYLRRKVPKNIKMLSFFYFLLFNLTCVFWEQILFGSSQLTIKVSLISLFVCWIGTVISPPCIRLSLHLAAGFPFLSWLNRHNCTPLFSRNSLTTIFPVLVFSDRPYLRARLEKLIWKEIYIRISVG